MQKNISTSTSLLSFFKEHNKELEKGVANKELTKGTLTKYNTIYAKLAEFIAGKYKKDDLHFSQIRRTFSKDFHKYLIKNKVSHNTAVTYVWMTGKILRLARSKGLLDIDPTTHYKETKKQQSITYLSLNELQAIHQVVPPSEILQLIKHLFLFSCYTGLSLKEIKAVSINNIVEEADSSLWFFVQRGHSNETRKIPILDKAQAIIARRVEKDSTLIFPCLIPNSTNVYLKQIATLANMKRDLTFSLGRYTFGTTVALEYMIPLHVVDATWGMKAIEKTEPYQELSQLYVIEEMKKLRSIMRERKSSQ